MSEYFPESKSSGGRVKVELDFSNYATKFAKKFAKKVDLASLKSDLDKSDIIN